MLHFLGMSYSLIAVTDFLSQLVGLVAAPYWGRLADRWGTKRLLTLALVAKAIFPFLWLGVLPQWWYMVFPVVLMRVFNTAQQIAFLKLALHLAPREDRAAYISMDRGLNNLLKAVAPAIAGVVAAKIGDSVWHLGALPFTALHFLFLLSGLFRLMALACLYRIREPRERQLELIQIDQNGSAPSD